MSLEKTAKENQRNLIQLEKYPVYETLPAYFELEYPKFTAFLDKYYRHSQDQKPGKFLKDLEYKRDFVDAQDDLLRFFSQELLLGRDYFDRFIDKQSAIQTSNLLYRSKGTKYSIQQFFRVFFGFDVDIRYGRDEVFLVGDPAKEELVIYKSQYRKGVLFPGQRLRFKFDDGDIQVYALAKNPVVTLTEGLYVLTTAGEYAENQDDYVEPYTRDIEYNTYHQLRQEIDYTIDYDDKSVVLQKMASGYEPVRDDPWINELAETGFMPEGMATKIEVKRFSPANSSVGAEVTNKRITNNGFWQIFALAIRAPRAINQWREAYKDFVHPAGMYLEGEVLVQSTNKLLGKQPSVILEEYRKPAFSEDDVLAAMQASITELNIRKTDTTKRVGYTQSGFVSNGRSPQNSLSGFDSGAQFYAEDRFDSNRPDEVYRSRINDIKRFDYTLEELDTQYQRMSHIDEIEARRLDNVEADMSNTINTVDENQWYGTADIFCLDSDRQTQTVLGSLLDFPREYAGCPGYVFNLFGALRPLQAQYESPKDMDRNPTYQPYDSYGDGAGTLFVHGIDSDGAGNPILMSDSDFRLGSVRGIQYRTDPGPVAGIGDGKLGGYRDQRVWGTTNDPYLRPGTAFDYTNPPYADSAVGWPDEMDYANPFQYAVTQGVAKVLRTYYFNRDPVTGVATGYVDLSPGTPSPGDSDRLHDRTHPHRFSRWNGIRVRSPRLLIRLTG